LLTLSWGDIPVTTNDELVSAAGIAGYGCDVFIDTFVVFSYVS
jgi:hypothetical protein